MGHTQLKIGMQGGHVEHRGETEVKVVQKEESEGRARSSLDRAEYLLVIISITKIILQYYKL
jgi:hypothetical protein